MPPSSKRFQVNRRYSLHPPVCKRAMNCDRHLPGLHSKLRFSPALPKERKPELRTSLFSLCPATLATLLAMVAGVRGDAIHADGTPWGFTATTTQIVNNGTSQQTSSINFAGNSGVNFGSMEIIPYTLTVSSSADPSVPSSFTDVPFDLKITLSDLQGAGSNNFVAPSAIAEFKGTFSATNVTKSSLIPGQIIYPAAPLTEVFTLGSPDTGWRDYHISLTDFTPPGPPGGAPGSIEAIVHVSPDNGASGQGTDPNPTPEPSSLFLAALGIPLLVTARRKARRVLGA
jgi:hypothetical protein